MAEVQENLDQIKNDLQKLSNLIHRSPMATSNKKKWKQQYNRQNQNLKDLLDECEQNIKQLPSSNVRHYVSAAKQFRKQHQQLQRDFQMKDRQQLNVTLPSERGEYETTSRVMKTIQRGDEAQQGAMQALNAMQKIAEEGISLADETNIQLHKQIQQMDRIHGKVKDTDSALKRAQKSLNYFMRALQCDKCMLGLIVLNALALIALIVLITKKK